MGLSRKSQIQQSMCTTCTVSQALHVVSKQDHVKQAAVSHIPLQTTSTRGVFEEHGLWVRHHLYWNLSLCQRASGPYSVAL
ncbi:hypothetical protein EYF80_007336 [Liparis tanakae]|uniref:Uncharacterized protein n=1 Tax=Liparis tanakae TaxID=230148 RepID=A0A4Z2IXK9_9TELE|nr:hypothetical protein EYF80_007336 [Liparis tanakae]